MHALDFWRTIAVDSTNLLESLVSLLAEQHIDYCIIGGQAVNAYTEPVVSLDLDIVVAAGEIGLVESLLRERFKVEEFPHSINVSDPGSDLRVQIQTDPRYATFTERAETKQVLGLVLPVASVEDVLKGKIWAASDPERRASKRQKDLADIARLLEAYPELRPQVPEEILARLF